MDMPRPKADACELDLDIAFLTHKIEDKHMILVNM